MLDVALLMANASQLKAVLEQGPEFKYYLTVIVLIVVSLFFQVLAGVFFILMGEQYSIIAFSATKACKAICQLFRHVVVSDSCYFPEGTADLCSCLLSSKKTPQNFPSHQHVKIST